MKEIEELNPRGFKTNAFISANLQTLFQRLIEFQAACEIDFHITSGLRSEEFQEELITEGKSSAPHSKHCAGGAADILDENGELGRWVLNNMDVVARIGLWFEDIAHTKGWVHAQVLAPRSGKRIFIP